MGTAGRLLGGLLLIGGIRAEEVLRDPPKIFGEELAPLLTPAEQVLKTDVSALAANAPGLTLLDEEVLSVDDAGRRSCAIQILRKAMTDAGARALAEETFVFRRKEQQFYFVRAETIQPDGTVQPVAANAVIVQSPQRRQQFALYDDEAEVRLVFPNVKPGSVTHVIVFRVDLLARMPGEFSQLFTWTATWPIGAIRYLVDVPAALDQRLHVETRGNGVPPAVRENRPNHRVRYTATKTQIQGVRDEINPAPAAQIGPCLHFSTVPDWAAVARWYGGLLAGRGEVNAALAAQVDTWTKGETTPEGTLRVLLAKVSSDVRYTGLELGEADYQPHDCNEVWANQYGDCKDKANLLVAMLRHKGIRAHLALLNTEHAGLIDRHNPDYRAFSHAIVAVPEGKDFLFCDPTIPYALPGVLSPSDADRDIFVLTDNAGKWTRTPVQSGGTLEYRFDLTLKATGELAGWLVVTGDRFFGAAQKDYYRKLDANEARRQLGELLRSFYPGAEVVDVVNQAGADGAADYCVKAYFLVPRRLESGARSQALTFPQTTGLFWSIGYSPERATPFFNYIGTLAVRCTVALPPGLSPGELPAPYLVTTPAGPIRAAWRVDNGSCGMELRLETTRSQLSPADFAGYYNAIQALRTWLEKPILLSASAAAPAATAPAAADDFPLMPTGTGQLALLDKRFPAGGNPDLRRAALEKTLQYFPSDKPTVFQAGVYLSDLDWAAGRKQEAVLRLQLLVAAYKSELPPNLHAFGELVYGDFLHKLERDAEAQEIFIRLAGASGVDDTLRARAALAGADLLKKTAPDKALELLEPAAALASAIRPEVYALWAYLLLQQDKAAALEQRLDELVRGHPAEAEDVLCRIARASGEWSAPGDEKIQEALVARLEKALPQPSPALSRAIAAAKSHRNSGALCSTLQSRIKTALASPPLSRWYAPSDDQTLKTDADFDLVIKDAQQNSKAERFLQLSVQALVTLPADNVFPRRLFRAILGGDWQEQTTAHAADVPAYELLLDCCSDLPDDEDVYQWGCLLRALHCARKGDPLKAQSILRLLLDNPALPPELKPTVLGNLGSCLEQSGDLEPAVQAYAGLETVPPAPERVTWLTRAVFLHLHFGRPARALEILKLLGSVDEAVLRRTEGAAQLRELLALQRSGKAEAFWAKRDRWWPKWEGLAKKMGVPAAGVETPVPLIASPNAWGVALGEALQANDRPAFFQELGRGISAARWLPDAAVTMSSLVGLVQRIAPELMPEFHELAIAMLEQAREAYTTPADSWKGQFMLAAHYFDNGQAAPALDVCVELNKLPQSDPDLGRMLRRLLGLAAAATRKHLDEAISALSKELEDRDLASGRADLVTILASLYREAKRPQDEEWLLKYELTNPVIQKDQAGRRQLAELYRRYGDPAAFLPMPEVQATSALAQRKSTAAATLQQVLPDPAKVIPGGPGDTRPAVAMIKHQPEYTPEMKKQNLRGDVLVAFVVDAFGKVQGAHAVGQANPVLAAAAVAAVSRWEFDPARKDGLKVSCPMQVTIRF